MSINLPSSPPKASISRLSLTLGLVVLAGCGPVEEQAFPDEYETVSQDLVVCASGPTVPGIDVSVYQGTIDWAKVHAAGKEFAIARIGDGLGHDATFPGHWAAIKANGMIRGAYQFFRPNIDPIAQADIVIAAVGRLGPGDLPVTLDVEAPGSLPSPAVYNQRIHAWVDRVEQATGKKPIIYVGKYYWANINTADFASHALWHPQYTTAACPNISNFWSTWKMWQYRGGPVSGIPGGTVSGISGYVDLNVFNGSLEQLRTFAGSQTCTPHCEGTVMVNAACERGDCGAFGLECAKDTLGLRCVFSQCPPTGETDVCLDDGHVAHCKDGILGPAGDCGAFGARCSTANAPTGARCVSVFCAASMTEAPHASEGCWPQQPARIASCDADGAFSFTECASGEQCSVVGGAHCEPRFCPATGTVDVCDGDTVAHCVEGQVVSALDCGASSSRCSPHGGVARCVATACVGDVSSAPVAHTTCLPSGWLAACDADGQVSHAEPCIEGASCVEGACVLPPVESPTSLGLMAPVEGRGCSAGAGGPLLLLALILLRNSLSPWGEGRGEGKHNRQT